MMLPISSAHSPAWDITDKAYVVAVPSPVGVGQPVTITIWTAQPLPLAALTNNIRKLNYQVIITQPNGQSTTDTWNIVPNPGGIQSFDYTPTQVGTYNVTFNFLGMTYPSASQVTSTVTLSATSINTYAGDTYSPETATASFTVQQAPLVPTYGEPLPTAYWTNPIYGQNSNWYTIASNWLGPSSAQLGTLQQGGYNLFQSSGSAPMSGHILWTKPIEFGGIVGGSNTGVSGASFYSGSSYQPRFYSAIIMDGYLYFKMPYSGDGTTTTVNGVVYGGAYECWNLRTGELVWQNTNPIFNPTWGQLYNEIDPNQSGVIPSGYLWQSVSGALVPSGYGTVWEAFDGFTGLWVFNITNIPSGTTVMGPSGEFLKYQLSYSTTTMTGWLALWNSSQLIFNPASPSSPYRPEGQSYNGSLATAYSWNVTINGDLDGWSVSAGTTTGVTLSGPSINYVIPGDLIFGTSSGLAPGVGPQYTPNPFTMWTINLNASVGAVGSILWVKNYTAPDIMANNNFLGSYTQRLGPLDPTTGVVTMQIGETMQWLGYDLHNGNLLWGPTNTVFVSQYQYFGSGLGIGQDAIDAYGQIYVQGYGGCVYCYNTANGNLVWTFGNGGEDNTTNDGVNSPWGLLPTMVTDVAAGMVYVYTTQHGNGAQSPYYKNEQIYCLNCTTGKLIWGMLSQCPNDGGPGYPEDIVADGVLVYYNMYDNQIYAVGQGPSATTVNAPDIGVTTATPITITGTVMDVSAGTQQNEQKADFANGVPCASDSSESLWMEYVYMQQPEPTNFTGVPVTLSVTDSNGNHYTIGTAVTNSMGEYGLTWTPIIQGNYTLYATFAGNNAYYGSSASTYFYAGAPAPTAPPYPTPVTGLASSATVELGIAAVIIVIVIIGAILAVIMLRKKP